MAKKFFNQKVKRKKKSKLPIIIIIASAILIFILVVLILNATKSKIPKNAVIKIRESVSIEANGSLPEKTTFFTELENVPEDKIEITYNNVNISVPGEYEVAIKVYDKKYYSKIIVLDNVAPELTLHDLTIKIGDTYKPADFVASCIDNSKSACSYEFYDKETDKNGKTIDFGNYTKKGVYVIKIVAKDNTGNVTQPEEATLTITDQKIADECEFGEARIEKGTAITVYATQSKCALSLNLFNDPETLKIANEAIEKEKAKLSEKFKTIDLNTKDVYIDAKIDPILNSTNTGLVGYLINFKIYIQRDGNNDVIENYVLNYDGSRTFAVNKYNLN